MPSISTTSLCSYAELQGNSISRLPLSFVKSLHTAEATLSYVCRDRIGRQSYESRDIYSRIELELAWSEVSTKVCDFTFGSNSPHLISKRIKEILTQKHQYNAEYLFRFNDKILSGKKKSIYFSRFRLYA